MAQETETLTAEELALQGLEESGLKDLDTPLPEEKPTAEETVPAIRFAVAVGFSSLAAAVMVGGVFIGVASPRIWAAIGAILGIVLAILAQKIKRPTPMHLVIFAGVFLIGLILVLPTGFSNVLDVADHARESASSGDVLRPPVPFTSGWRAIVGWLMGGLGFASAWVAVEVRRPALALLLPLPVVAITAVSVPENAQLPSGIVSLVLFAVSLGVLSGADIGGEAERRISIAYEIRRGLRALPMIAAITGGLIVLAQAKLLFPPPLYDPTQEARRPKAVPISEVEDRVLFRTKSGISGPWRMGTLDVYDGKDWRLPPFAQSKLVEVPRSGVVDSDLIPGIKATFQIVGLEGAVLPGLPNTVGMVAEGPKLAYDHRTGNIRLAQGAIRSGLEYTVVAAVIPTVEVLQGVNEQFPKEVESFLEIPEPPPAVKELLAQAPTTSLWQKMDFVRQTFLSTVVSKGSGVPVSVPPSRVQDMLAGSKEGTPFEIVAAQAMLARWAGVPSRIGYGYDGGEQAGDFLEVRPKHGASFLEVYFPTFKWLPVIGTPVQAKTSIGTDPQQFNPNVIASDEVAVKLFIPFALDSKTYLYAQVQRAILVLLPIVAVGLIAFYGWPAVRKASLRYRRRVWAARAGPAQRIAVAYAEWRDLATDFGYRHETDTPLMFLDRVVEDEEHRELAWLVTRGLWGDLQGAVGPAEADAAEELSRSLKKRLSQAHSGTLRGIAAVSRLSLRYPFAPRLGQEEEAHEPKAA